MALNFPVNPVLNQTFSFGGKTWKYDGTAWNIVVSVFEEGILDVPATLTDLGILEGTIGQVLTTNGAGTYSFQDPGQQGAITLNELTDVSVANPSLNDFLKYDGTSWTASSIGSALNFSDTQDANTASLTVDKFYMPAIAMLRVDAVGVSAYTFLSHYTGENPRIYALAGTTIAFNLDGASGHPFEIQTSTANPISSGLTHVDSSGNVLTGLNAQGKQSGVLYWEITEDTATNFRYQCQNHIGMAGIIEVKRLSFI